MPSIHATGVDLAIATLCFDGFEDADFRHAFEHLPETGVRNVEFNCWYPRTLTVDGLRRIRERSAQIGVTPVSIHVATPPLAPNSGSRTAEVARWMWLLEAADRIGARVLKTTGVARQESAHLAEFIELLKTVAPIVEDRGITIAVENHFNNTFEYPEDYERLFEEVSSPSVGMCLDTGHFAASGVDMIDVIERFGSRLVHIDLKDCASVGAEHFVPFGHGLVDFDSVLGSAVSSGFEGYLVVEFPRRGWDGVLENLRAGIDIASRYAPEAR